MKIDLKLSLLIIAVILLAATAGFLYSAKRSIEKPNDEIRENTLIKIEKDSNTKTISAYLYNQHLIKNQNLYIYATKLFNKIVKPGYYEIPAGASMADIINLVDSGKVKLIKVTIPEGWRLEQIARKLDQEKILSYANFVEEASSLEGKIFPDTYYLNPKMEAEEVLSMMTGNFEDRTAGLNLTDEALILASIIEREASKDSERAVIAGVYKNRLKRKMKLEADPTVQYGRDNVEIKNNSFEAQIDFKFWQPVSFADYKSVSSEYNTYAISGLPPKPICNPGLKSIEAALNPQEHDYLFFLQHDGQIYLSKTLAEHDRYRRTVLGQK